MNLHVLNLKRSDYPVQRWSHESKTAEVYPYWVPRSSFRFLPSFLHSYVATVHKGVGVE